MGWFDTLFGGTDKSAQKAQLAQNQEAKDFIREQTAKAESVIRQLFPQAQQELTRGTNRAAGIFGGVVPQQMDVLQQGNVGAQAALLAGLPQIQNALLGGAVDFSGLQPQTLNFNPSVFQQFAGQGQTATAPDAIPFMPSFNMMHATLPPTQQIDPAPVAMSPNDAMQPGFNFPIFANTNPVKGPR